MPSAAGGGMGHSMKVPPKRKGNTDLHLMLRGIQALNESPSEKEGKWFCWMSRASTECTLNESPSEKEGKFVKVVRVLDELNPSMKVPPKRKGNGVSPSEFDRL